MCVYLSIQGFDEFMNLVMDDAEEVYVKDKKRRPVGKCLLVESMVTLLYPDFIFSSLRTNTAERR